MSDSASGDALRKAHAEAYKAYVSALKENLANVDVSSLETPVSQAVPNLATFFTYNTFHTWNTYSTFHTLSTYNTQSTLATRSTIATESCLQ